MYLEYKKMNKINPTLDAMMKFLKRREKKNQ